MSHSHDHDDHGHEPHWLIVIRGYRRTPARVMMETLKPVKVSQVPPPKERDAHATLYLRWQERVEIEHRPHLPPLKPPPGYQGTQDEYEKEVLQKREEAQQEENKKYRHMVIWRAWKAYLLIPVSLLLSPFGLFMFFCAIAYPLGYAVGVLIGVALLLFLIPIL